MHFGIFTVGDVTADPATGRVAQSAPLRGAVGQVYIRPAP
jgi:hypothetical protein